MQALKERKYELYVEFFNEVSPDLADVFITAGESLQPLDNIDPTKIIDTFSKSGYRSALITDLNIKVEIDFSKEKGNTTSNIQVINASKDTIDKISNPNSKVLLRAGYSDSDLSNIFVGQVTDAHTEILGHDTVTTLIVNDGYTVKNSARITRSWPPKTYYGQIINDLVDEMVKGGFSKGDIVLNVSSSKNQVRVAPQFKWALGGFSCEGFIDDILKELANAFALEYFIFQNRIYITPFDQPPIRTLNMPESSIKTISSSSASRSSQAAESKKKKFTVTTFLKGELDISDKVKILSGNYEGDYKILSVKYKLDYLGSDWDTILEIEAI